MPIPNSSFHRLFLLRHAKAANPEGVEDHARPLAERGREDAMRLGRFLKEQGFMDAPPHCLCSTSLRTRETYEALCEGLGAAPKVSYLDALYHASPGEMLAQLQRRKESGSLLVIGHNPGLHQLCLHLADAASPELLKDLRFRFPTCALAEFEAAGAWEALAPGGAKLVGFYLSHRASAQD